MTSLIPGCSPMSRAGPELLDGSNPASGRCLSEHQQTPITTDAAAPRTSTIYCTLPRLEKPQTVGFRCNRAGRPVRRPSHSLAYLLTAGTRPPHHPLDRLSWFPDGLSRRLQTIKRPAYPWPKYSSKKRRRSAIVPWQHQSSCLGNYSDQCVKQVTTAPRPAVLLRQGGSRYRPRGR